MSSREYTLPINPSPAMLERDLAAISNNMARLSDLVATYKADAAIKQTVYKRAYARALVEYSGDKNATIIKAKADIYPAVISAQDEMDQANAVYIVATGEYEGYEAQFVALRKMVEIRKMEARTV